MAYKLNMTGKEFEQRIKNPQPVNLLDNSDFTNPVNQRGKTTYTAEYGIDRWRTWNEGVITVNDNSILASNDSLFQYHEVSKFKDTNYTLCAKRTNGTINLKIANPLDKFTWDSGQLWIGQEGIGEREVTIVLAPGEYEWAALYEGEYTLANLPEYQPKGYSAELQECQRYYLNLPYSNTLFYGNTGSSSGTNVRLFLPTPVTMRKAPVTVSFVLTFSGFANNVNYSATSIDKTPNGLAFYGTTDVVLSTSPTYVTVMAQLRNSNLELFADF